MNVFLFVWKGAEMGCMYICVGDDKEAVSGAEVEIFV